MLKKIIYIILSIFIVLLSVGVALFYRPDVALTTLEKTYFLDQSSYLDVTINTLEGTALSVRTHLLDYGDPSDPTIVLLHGAFASSHTFIPWAHMLNESGYRVIAIDLPYHGLSGGFEDQVTSIRRSAAVVYEVIKALEIDSFVIGGNSMGGGVSWYFAGEYGEILDIKGLVLISPVAYTTGNNQSRGFLSNPMIAPIASKMTPRFLLKSILNGVYGTASTLEDETIDRYYDLIRKEGFRYGLLRNTQEDLSLKMTPIDRFEKIKDLKIPALIMWGIEDAWIPYELSLLFKTTWDLSDEDIIIYEGLGHVAMEEDPQRTMVDLLLFLNRLTP